MTVFQPPTHILSYIHTYGLTAVLGTVGQVSGPLGASRTQVLIRQTKACAEGAGFDAALSGLPLPRYNAECRCVPELSSLDQGQADREPADKTKVECDGGAFYFKKRFR